MGFVCIYTFTDSFLSHSASTKSARRSDLWLWYRFELHSKHNSTFSYYIVHFLLLIPFAMLVDLTLPPPSPPPRRRRSSFFLISDFSVYAFFFASFSFNFLILWSFFIVISLQFHFIRLFAFLFLTLQHFFLPANSAQIV